MPLTNLTKLPRATQTNGRYLLAPIAWVIAGMLAFARVAGTEPAVPERAVAPIVPEISIDVPDDDPLDDSVDETAIVPETITRPARPAITKMQPRPIRRGAFFADLRRPLNLNEWRVSTWDNDHQGAFYGGAWAAENIIQEHDRLILKVKAGENGERPTMAELQSRRKCGYGRYEVIMRPSDESGIVSTFFTHTGRHAGDPHDEVDIEFVGTRSKTVEFNYWKNGRKGADTRQPVDFNVSETMNLYAFEWHPDEVIWFVNGEELYRSPRNSAQVPNHPGNIFISAWTGTPSMAAWTGAPDFGESAQAEYACVSFTPFDGTSYTCADLWAEDPQFQTLDDRLSDD